MKRYEDMEKEELIEEIQRLKKADDWTKPDYFWAIGKIVGMLENEDEQGIKRTDDEYIGGNTFTKSGLRKIYNFLVEECGYDEVDFDECPPPHP